MPPAPPTFSTMIGCPSTSPMRCANSRATTSLGPPAAKGLIMVRGWVGHGSALATPVNIRGAAATSAVTTLHMVYSQYSFCFVSDERDRFGHLQNSADFDQRALEVGFGCGRTQTEPDAEVFAFHASQRAGRRE